MIFETLRHNWKEFNEYLQKGTGMSDLKIICSNALCVPCSWNHSANVVVSAHKGIQIVCACTRAFEKDECCRNHVRKFHRKQ